ncbi:MAG: tetratricopeptide repeat protein [Pirellulales bacterium]
MKRSLATTTRRFLLSHGALIVAGALSLGAGCSNVTSTALNSEGVKLYQQGNYQLASDRFQQAIAHDPDSSNAYYNLAASLHKAGVLYNRPADLQQAELLYNQCLERDPQHTDCYRGLAVLLTETGRQTEAFRLLNNWNAASPQLAEPKVELARLLEETGQVAEAKSKLVEALNAEPHNARALTALGRLRDQAGDYSQALTNYQRSLLINHNQPEVAARVAALQATALTAPSSFVPSQSDAQISSRWQPAVKY